ncbi:MAG: hypothetical protein EPN97_07505 [Alphaproteobacteria bacterium]|nr:MAG: hypothetical protein EPN97_07505 [Alphaproteobacteria bacterium]
MIAVDADKLPKDKKIELLALIAQEVTVCARGTTYEAGTSNVLKPQLLRAYNELQNRITGSLRDYIRDSEGVTLKAILEMIKEFGKTHGVQSELESGLARAMTLLHERGNF